SAARALGAPTGTRLRAEQAHLDADAGLDPVHGPRAPGAGRPESVGPIRVAPDACGLGARRPVRVAGLSGSGDVSDAGARAQPAGAGEEVLTRCGVYELVRVGGSGPE